MEEQEQRPGRASGLRADLSHALKTYKGCVEALRAYLLTLPDEPSAEQLAAISQRQADIISALAVYDSLKTKHRHHLLAKRQD